MATTTSLPDAIHPSQPSSRTHPADLHTIAADIAPRYGALRQAAEMYADHQKHRIKVGNQIGSMTIDAINYAPYAAAMKDEEERLSKEMKRLYRAAVSPELLEWQNATLGIGDHLLARLLGHLGHPHLALPKHWARNSTVDDDAFGDVDNPKRMLVTGDPFLRSVSQLWQYCGHGLAQRRRKGMDQAEAFALGNPRCKMLTHLLAEAVVKSQIRKDGENRYALDHLGQLYLETRAKYQDRGHSGPCSGGYTSAGSRVVFVKCKVDGRYAEEGDPFQPSHVNAIALRHLGKEILRQIWVFSSEDWTS